MRLLLEVVDQPARLDDMRVVGRRDDDATAAVAVDQVAGPHRDAADLRRLAVAGPAQRRVLDHPGDREHAESLIDDAGQVADPARGHHADGAGGDEALGHAVAHHALPIRIGADRLHHDHARQLARLDRVHHLDVGIVRRPAFRGAGIDLDRDRLTHQRRQVRRHAPDAPIHRVGVRLGAAERRERVADEGGLRVPEAVDQCLVHQTRERTGRPIARQGTGEP